MNVEEHFRPVLTICECLMQGSGARAVYTFDLFIVCLIVRRAKCDSVRCCGVVLHLSDLAFVVDVDENG